MFPPCVDRFGQFRPIGSGIPSLWRQPARRNVVPALLAQGEPIRRISTAVHMYDVSSSSALSGGPAAVRRTRSRRPCRCREDAGSWHRSGRRIGRTLTVWISAAEVLAALLGSPLYRAVSEWLPTASEETVKLAVPAAS